MNDRSIPERLQYAMAVREFRLQVGKDANAVEWQYVMEQMLIRLSENLVVNQVTTIDPITDRERLFFNHIASNADLPTGTVAIYLPPSALETMLQVHREAPGTQEIRELPEKGSDSGILLAAESNIGDRIVFAQFAASPHVPGIELYEDGEIVAVYPFESLETCRQALWPTVRRHLSPQARSHS